MILILLSMTNINSLYIKGNKVMTDLSNWLLANRLTLNVDKTNFTIFSYTGETTRDYDNLQLHFNNNELSMRASCVKYHRCHRVMTALAKHSFNFTGCRSNSASSLRQCCLRTKYCQPARQRTSTTSSQSTCPQGLSGNPVQTYYLLRHLGRCLLNVRLFSLHRSCGGTVSYAKVENKNSKIKRLCSKKSKMKKSNIKKIA